jgi:hypothetical protein
VKYLLLILYLGCILSSCENKDAQLEKLKSLSNSKIPDNIPIDFRPDLIKNDQLIHKAILSPDFKQFFFTISDKDFSNFNVKSIQKIGDNWSKPQNAFFNSEFDDHGMCFSPDGNTIYFSSTRIVNNDSIPKTWHIWKTTKIDKKWTAPEFIDIPNLRDKLVSHLSISQNGRLYFHSSNLDYTKMNIYYADQVNGKFQEAKPLFPFKNDLANRCTPFISPQEDYIIYAKIEQQLKLMISYKDDHQNWGKHEELNNIINSNGQGNPYVTSDNKFLFYTTGDFNSSNWKIRWVSTENIIKN